MSKIYLCGESTVKEMYVGSQAVPGSANVLLQNLTKFDNGVFKKPVQKIGPRLSGCDKKSESKWDFYSFPFPSTFIVHIKTSVLLSKLKQRWYTFRALKTIL